MWDNKKLEAILTKPSSRLIEDIKKIDDDIMILGAGGKMGPTMAILAANAMKEAGLNHNVIAVSRFSNPEVVEKLDEAGVKMISCDLSDSEQVAKLPVTKHIIMMVGRKFGTSGAECETWGMNAFVPVLIADHFKGSTFVVFSSGNIYPIVNASSGGSSENDVVHPIGEYTQSCLARERIFEYAAKHYGSKVLIFRLSYAIALEYGVLSDIAGKIWNNEPVELGNTCFNCIWQGDANEFAIRCLLHAENPARILNITGPEVAGVKSVALRLGELLGKKVQFTGCENSDAYLENSTKATSLLGYPSIPLDTMIQWQAEWIQDGGRNLGKPTHFEERKGSY